MVPCGIRGIWGGTLWTPKWTPLRTLYPRIPQYGHPQDPYMGTLSGALQAIYPSEGVISPLLIMGCTQALLGTGTTSG